MTTTGDHNLYGLDYQNQSHLHNRDGVLIDVHTHVHLSNGKHEAEFLQAEQVVSVAQEFGVRCIWSMSPARDIPRLRERFGDLFVFNGYIDKSSGEPDSGVFRRLEEYFEAGVKIVKLWAGPRAGRTNFQLDAPWRVQVVRRAVAAGIRVFMAHIADPDLRFRHFYDDRNLFGSKADHFAALERMLCLFPDVIWIVAHMGGSPEDPDRLESLLERHPNLHFDTSATKWQVREVSSRHERYHALISRWSKRFLFGSDVVTRTGTQRELYASRYWCQRTLWESQYQGPSPIADEDWQLENSTKSPQLCGLGLPESVLANVNSGNANRILPVPGLKTCRG